MASNKAIITGLISLIPAKSSLVLTIGSSARSDAVMRTGFSLYIENIVKDQTSAAKTSMCQASETFDVRRKAATTVVSAPTLQAPCNFGRSKVAVLFCLLSTC